MLDQKTTRIPLQKKLQKKLKKLNLTNRVIFCGNISDMPALYSLADIVLSTSTEPEAFGRVSAEAGSMTKPVIASNHGGSREIIENNVSGWLVPPSNPEALAEKITFVLELSQQKDLIGNNARKRVIEKFSLRQMLDKTIKVYEELIAAKEILVIKFGGLGDVILSLSAMYSIFRKFNRKITLLTEEPFNSLLKKSNWFNEIQTIKRSMFYTYDIFQIKRKLKYEDFSEIFDLQTSRRSSYYLKLFKKSGGQTNGIGKYSTISHSNIKRDFMHTIERQKDQLSLSNIKFIKNPDLKWLYNQKSKFKEKKIALIVPGGSKSRLNKRIPLKIFFEITSLF